MKENYYVSKLNNIRISPKKVRLVVNLVKEMEIEKALEQLDFTNKNAAKYVKKALSSAVSNAKYKDSVKPSDLEIAEMFVTEALTYKRGKPVARGRYHAIFRRGSNLTIKLKQKS